MVCIDDETATGSTIYVGYHCEDINVIACGIFDKEEPIELSKEHSYIENNKIPMVINAMNQIYSKKPINSPIQGRNY